MPGIYGFYNMLGNAPQNINAMNRVMRHNPSEIQDPPMIDNGFACSRVHLGHVGSQTSPQSESALHCWVEGEVYNLSDVLRIFSWHHTSDQELDFGQWLLKAYKLNKLDAFLAEIDGYYCSVIYDQLKKKILLISDRYGMRLLYWYQKNNGFAWSSEVKAILALPNIDTAEDARALPCFMDLGYLLGDRTWFENIKLIKPASVLEYDVFDGTVKHHYYWTWAAIKPSGLGFDDAVEALGSIFLESVSKRVNPEKSIGISLSGGLDSRVILAAVHTLYPEYKGYAYTFGQPGCEDIRISQKVIELTNWRHQCFYFTENNWFDLRIDRISSTDGMLDMKHMHGSEFLAIVAENMSINLNGYAGDVVCGGGWFSRLPTDERINSVNSKLVYQEYYNDAAVDDPFYDIRHIEPNLYMNRVRRFTNMGSVNALSVIDQRKPFLDNKLMELIYSIPDTFRKRNLLYSVMLQRTFPEFFQSIPWQKTGKPAGLVEKRGISQRVWEKVRRTVTAKIQKSHISDFTDYANWLRDPEITTKLQILFDQSEAHDLNRMYDIKYKLWMHVNNHRHDYSDAILRAATYVLYKQVTYNYTMLNDNGT